MGDFVILNLIGLHFCKKMCKVLQKGLQKM